MAKKKTTRGSASSRKKRLTGKEKRQAQKVKADNPLLSSGPWYQRPETLLIAIAMIASLLVYIPPMDFGFVNWDDPEYVTENTRVLNPSGENIMKFWTDVKDLGSDTETYSIANAHNYHPLTMTSLALTQKFFGNEAFPHRLINVILHLLNVMLVFLFVRMFSKGNNLIAFFVAFVFGTHAMHVESVAWVTERKDVLFTLFYVWAMILYLKYLGNREMKYLLYAGILFVLSLFSKPTAATLPAVFLLLDYYHERPLLDKKVILEKLPFIILGLIFLLITYTIQKAEAIGDFEYYTIWQRVMFAGYGFMMYIVKLFVPVDLVAFYPYPDVKDIPATFIVAPFISLLIIAGTIFSMRKTRIIAFGMGFYLASIALTLQFITVGSTVMSDRYTYISYIGLLLVIGYGLDYLIKQKPALKMAIYGATGAVMLIWAFAGFQRTQVWENDFTLWDNVIETYPNQIAGSYMSRGKYYKDNGDFDKALLDFNTSISLDKTNDRVFNNRGNIYFSRNQDDLALPDYNRAIELKDNVARYYDNRGALYARKGQFELAIQDMKKAVQLDPEFSNAYKNLGVCYSTMNNPQEAAKYFGEYLRIFPQEHGIMNAQAIEYQRMGNQQAALQSLNHAIGLAPNQGLYYGNRAFTHKALGNKQQGLADINKAISLGLNQDEKVTQLIQDLNALP